MSLASSIAVFFVIWWLALFLVLPFGIRSQQDMDEVTLGTDRGAPHQPYILRRIAATTVLAAIIFAGVYLFFGVYEMSLEDLLP